MTVKYINLTVGVDSGSGSAQATIKERNAREQTVLKKVPLNRSN